MQKWHIAVFFALTFATTSFSNIFDLRVAAQPAAIDCGNFWADDAVPDIRDGGAFLCYEYDPRNASLSVGPGTNYRIFYTEQWGRVPRPLSTAYLEAVAESLDHSVAYFGRHLSPYPTTILVSEIIALESGSDPLSPLDWDTGATAAGTWINADEACPIVTYSTTFDDATENMDSVKQLIAHEIFHCFQAAHYGDKMDDNYEGTSWWVEGTAEYFSHAAYTCVNDEHGQSSSYDPAAPLFDQGWGYPNVAFFQFLSAVDGLGESGVIRLIASMPDDETRAGQVSALSSFPDMHGRFHRFGQAYLDNAIPDCGEPMPLTINNGSVEDIGIASVVKLEAHSYALERKVIRLMPGRKYTINTISRENSGKVSARRTDQPGEWGDLPEELTTPCDGEVEYQLLATAATHNEEIFRADIIIYSEDDPDTDECVPCKDTGQQDACLFGKWRLNSGDAEQWLRGVYGGFSASSSSITLNDVNIRATFTAFPDGTATGILEELSADAEIRIRSGDRNIISQALLSGGGRSTSTWSTEDGVLYGCPVTSDIELQSQIFIEGIDTEPYPIDLENDAVGGISFNYVCNGATATITHEPKDLPPQIYRWRKD